MFFNLAFTSAFQVWSRQNYCMSTKMLFVMALYLFMCEETLVGPILSRGHNELKASG